jgi:Ca2+-binding RTX toxin-like protein
LTGSTGSDRFVLGDATKTYYLGNGMSDYALITDFGVGDVIQKSGLDNLTIGGALPTGIYGSAIYRGTDLIAVVQGSIPTLAAFVSV